ncbi:hypothetical protein QBC34DRAFT_411810 [Podospora aff. communis PSN243]|uniref:Transcriptional regulator n=1 Tax=Podospora aff. communis PSN243 TaxID=3040156 RepID=A0AAV9GCQ5_9PEZI|nr:hypothetical protein QBC34DRAFT_411810 [Podospora aff. communis PSN243]
MAPKKVPDKATLEQELRDAVRRIYQQDKTSLTVNSARQAVETKLKLKDGFFRDDGWKARSKEIIHEALAQVEADADANAAPPEPTPQTTPEPAKKAKPKPKQKSQPKPKPKSSPAKKKRAKRAPTSDEEFPDVSEESEMSVESTPEASEPEFESEPEVKPKSKAKANNGAPARKRGQRAVISDDEDEASPKPAKRRKLAKAKAVVDSDPEDSSPLSEAMDTPMKDTDVSGTEASPVKKEAKKVAKKEEAEGSDTSVLDESPKKAKAKAADKTDKQDDDGSDTSVVYDEPPKRKGKANKSEAAPKKRESQGPKEAASDQTPDDALIKQLQGQLLKCGVRKIWAFELKKYGDDKKAKIRHLKGMLSDVGMKGRFSESRAREIKELRELQADLEAVMEGEKSWGVSGRPARRRAAKGFKEPSDDEDSDEGPRKKADNASSGSGGSDDESESDVQPKVHGGAKRRADLAFLGDESESD